MNAENKKENLEMIDATEYDAAVEEAKNVGDSYVYTFKQPFLWQGKEYTALHFDFEGLSGRDMINIEKELALTEGVNVLVPTMSSPFLFNMAARASGIGYDAILAMPLRDANAIRSMARSFLMSSEL